MELPILIEAYLAHKMLSAVATYEKNGFVYIRTNDKSREWYRYSLHNDTFQRFISKTEQEDIHLSVPNEQTELL